MKLFGYDVRLSVKALPPLRPLSSGGSGWFPLIVREPYTGAWQENQELRADTVLTNPTVFACVTRIAQDIAKLRLRLVTHSGNGVWTETTNPAYSPVLRKPNRYQNPIKFVEQWITSKLTWGNTYALKQRDQRGVVNALYLLDPNAVTPLIAPDGAVYYQLGRHELAGTATTTTSVTVPAREVIHDRMVCLFHPLIGVSPLLAAGVAASQGNTIMSTSSRFFANGQQPGGVLTAPGAISDETAGRIKTFWDANFTGANVGRVAVLGDGLKYDQLSVNASDSQLIEQLQWTSEQIAMCFGVPLFMLNSTKGAPYANNEPIVQLYYAQCLQSLIANFEMSLDEGLEFGTSELGTEFDIDDLIWMDTTTRTKAAADSINAGAMTPNEARQKYFGLGPVKGGDTPYMQQQYFSLAALAERDAEQPFAKAPAASQTEPPTEEDDEDEFEAAAAVLLKKDWAHLCDA